MSNVLTPGPRPLMFILREANGQRSRDNLMIAEGETVVAGQVCGVLTATGEAVPFDPAGEDGSETVAAIACYPYDATDAAVMGAFVTSDCELIEGELVWPDGISAPNKAAAYEALAAKGLKIRPESYV